jgi:hypothetical protein
VLQSLGESLKSVEYIAVDGCYERGVQKYQTFSSISNYLIAQNFEMIDIFLSWARALFRNKIFQ